MAILCPRLSFNVHINPHGCLDQTHHKLWTIWWSYKGCGHKCDRNVSFFLSWFQNARERDEKEARGCFKGCGWEWGEGKVRNSWKNKSRWLWGLWMLSVSPQQKHWRYCLRSSYVLFSRCCEKTASFYKAPWCVSMTTAQLIAISMAWAHSWSTLPGQRTKETI